MSFGESPQNPAQKALDLKKDISLKNTKGKKTKYPKNLLNGSFQQKLKVPRYSDDQLIVWEYL